MMEPGARDKTADVRVSAERAGKGAGKSRFIVEFQRLSMLDLNKLTYKIVFVMGTWQKIRTAHTRNYTNKAGEWSAGCARDTQHT